MVQGRHALALKEHKQIISSIIEGNYLAAEKMLIDHSAKVETKFLLY